MRVALVSEGTYPYAMGGVSVWCDQLMSGLPQHDFEFVALTADGRERPLWEPPANLRRLTTVPLWTPNPPHSADTGAQGHPVASDLVEQLVAPFHDDLDADDRRVGAFADALHWVAIIARQRGTTADLFTNNRTVDTLCRAWRSAHGTALSVKDAVEWCVAMEHLLRPLQYEPVQADVVHSSMNGPSMLIGLAAHWSYGTPVVMSEHGIYLRERYLLEETAGSTPNYRRLRLHFFRLVAQASYRIAAAVASHSRYNRRWALVCGAHPGRLHTMYNGVQVEQFQPPTVEPTTPTVVFLGRVDPIKDVRTLIRAFTHVHRELPEARLRVCGAAPLGQEAYLAGCHDLCAELGLSEAVDFVGHVKDPVSAYHTGSVVALSSISEGFPYSVIEAMACGRPVVCTQVGGVAEAVGDGGIVVPPQDPVAFGRALLSLLRDEDVRLRTGRAARERVAGMFGQQRWLDAYDRLYQVVTGASSLPEERNPIRRAEVLSETVVAS